MNPPPSDNAASFSGRLIDWQAQHGRHDLPWQQTRDAYRIWLSEIMLQQTQVRTAAPYYARFLESFPDIETLAAAPLDRVLELWAGLGYYARARNLHRCAQGVVADHGGHFPQHPEKIAELPGIGRSTAAAISVFAFGQRAAILDGNVKRVLTRCFGVAGFPGAALIERQLWGLAESLLPARQIETYTQGLMDLGATLCTRSKPRCAACPMSEICVARQRGLQAVLPTAKPGKILPERQSSVLLLTDGQRVLLERRPPSGIWGGLLALPEVPAESAASFAMRHDCRLLGVQAMAPLRHGFTHFRLTLHAALCLAELPTRCVDAAGWTWLDLREVDGAALPTPVKKLLRLAAGLSGQPQPHQP